MAKIAVFRWPAPDNAAISALQGIVAPGFISINGSMSVSVNGGNPSVTFQGFSRVVTITSVNNLAAANFTITGTYNGSPQVVTIAGPNAATVSSVLLFDSVTSVFSSAPAAALSVGVGAVGQTHWYTADNFSNTEDLSVQVVVTGAITYSFQSTLDQVGTPIAPTVFNTISPMTNATTSLFLPNAILSIGAGPTIIYARMPIRYCNISVTAGTGSLVATILQQGLIS